MLRVLDISLFLSRMRFDSEALVRAFAMELRSHMMLSSWMRFDVGSSAIATAMSPQQDCLLVGRRGFCRLLLRLTRLQGSYRL
jgi:hypothetical protein